MSVYEAMTSLADAIRRKTGRVDKLSLSEMTAAVDGITDPLSSVADGSVTDLTAADLAGAASVRDYAFYKCAALESVALPDTVTGIGAYAFHTCSALWSVDLPEGLTTIGTRAFQNCKALERIVIPASVTNIPAACFMSSGVTTVILVGDTVKTLAASSAFSSTPLTDMEEPTIYIATVEGDVDALIAEYSEATNWSSYFTFKPASELLEVDA